MALVSFGYGSPEQGSIVASGLTTGIGTLSVVIYPPVISVYVSIVAPTLKIRYYSSTLGVLNEDGATSVSERNAAVTLLDRRGQMSDRNRSSFIEAQNREGSIEESTEETFMPFDLSFVERSNRDSEVSSVVSSDSGEYRLIQVTKLMRDGLISVTSETIQDPDDDIISLEERNSTINLE